MERFLQSILILFLIISSASAFSSSSVNVELLPSTLECQSVVQSYPVTLLSKLFSSVPKREFAVENVSLKFGDTGSPIGDEDYLNHLNFNLLVGRSASGKSTILRIVSGDEKPLSGNVLLNGSKLYPMDEQSSEVPLSKPIMLDSKPDCFDDRFTVIERIVAEADNKSLLSQLDGTLAERLGRNYATILNLSDDELEGVASELSPSGQYLFGIAIACMKSSTVAVSISEGKDECKVKVSLPILLLDELLDSETSVIAGKVGEGLRNLTRRGGIVLAATHRPKYLSNAADRIITMSGGKVLMVKNCERV